jgi:multidrug efflux system membrane fusion protein
MTKSRRAITIAVAGVILVAIIAVVMTHGPQQQTGNAGRRFGRGGSGDQPVPTLVATAQTADVPVYLDGVGTTRALNTVTVRAQVDGKLIAVNFKEGQDVERGFVLAKIDPTIYQAQYDQAVAKKAQDEATLENARRDLDRYTRLAATNALATQQADTQKSLVAQLEAQIRGDQGAIDNAKGVLQYTDIVAPIAGRTGIRQVDVGNIVHASDTGGIVVITQMHPISILFTLPQQQLSQVNNAAAKGPLTVEAFGSDNKTVVDKGTLIVVDNQVDQTTGTIKLKAEFPNPNLQLWPGQFINVRLLVDTLQHVVVVPTAAVQRGPNGPFVFVVRNDNVAVMRPVTISQQDENQTVVATGLQAGERVATTSFNQLTDGRRVAVSNGANGDAATPPANGEGNGRRRPRRDGAAQSEETSSSGERRSARESSNPTP